MKIYRIILQHTDNEQKLNDNNEEQKPSDNNQNTIENVIQSTQTGGASTLIAVV